MGGLRFSVDGEGNYGYLKADDSFVPFKSGFTSANLLKSTSSNDKASTLEYVATKKQTVLVTILCGGKSENSSNNLDGTTGNILINLEHIGTGVSKTLYCSRTAVVELESGEKISAYGYAYSYGRVFISVYELS